MQAIVTKYLAPTNHHGARVKATCDTGSDRPFTATVAWDYALSTPDNHRAAAVEVCRLRGYNPPAHRATMPGGWDYVFLAD